MSVQIELPPTAPEIRIAGSDRAPLVELVQRYRADGAVPFSGPGHKLGAGAAPELLDLMGGVFASDVWLDTGGFDQALRDAEALAADVWGSETCFFLGNGSSSGNHAFLLGTLGPGDEVVVARDLHKSLLAALILTGARPVYVAPRLHRTLGVGLGVHPDDVAAALDAHPAARLVVVTSPSYFGVAADLPAVVAAAHSRAVPVYVDEAWGPHLGFHPRLPSSAMAAGADAAVTSTHKLLSSLSQSSILNIRWGRLPAGRVEAAVKLTQTTSPLLPLLASVDACRRQMAGNGQALLERALELAETARQRLRRLPGLRLLDADSLSLARHRFDPTRLVVDVTGLGLTGLAAERVLREGCALAPEGSDLSSVVCLVTLGDSDRSIDQLVGAFTKLCAGRPAVARPAPAPRSSGSVIGPSPLAMTPREAFFAPTRALAVVDAAGHVAAELVTPYPPGIPVLAPGELITAAKLRYLIAARANGVHLRGPADPTLATIRVVAAERSEPPWTT